MKKLLQFFFLALMVFGLPAAEPLDLYRLTIINKSGMPLAVQLVGQTQEQFYYLTVAAGDRQQPTEKSFTLVGDLYFVRPFYLETYDPVYGFQCGPAPITRLFLTHNTRLTFIECGRRPGTRGEPGYMKYWFWFPGYLY